MLHVAFAILLRQFGYIVAIFLLTQPGSRSETSPTLAKSSGADDHGCWTVLNLSTGMFDGILWKHT